MVVNKLSPLFAVEACVAAFTFLAGLLGLVLVLLSDLDVSADLKDVVANHVTLGLLVGSGALVSAADSVDAIKLIRDLLLVGLVHLAGAALELKERTRAVTVIAWGQVAIAVELVNSIGGPGSIVTLVSGIASAILNLLSLLSACTAA